VKLAEIGAMIFGAGALWLDNPYLDLMVLFFAGTLAAFFGPIKYGILPQYLKKEEVIGGNAMIEMGTFVTILLGTMFGGFLVIDTEGRQILSGSLVLLSLIAWYATTRMPPAPSTTPDLDIDWNVVRQTGKLLGYARERHDVFWAVIGASWFWFVGTVLLVQFPVFTKDILLANEDVATPSSPPSPLALALAHDHQSLLKGEVSPNMCRGRHHDDGFPDRSLFRRAGQRQACGTASTAPAYSFPAGQLARCLTFSPPLRRHLRGAAQCHHANPCLAANAARDCRQQCRQCDFHDHGHGSLGHPAAIHLTRGCSSVRPANAVAADLPPPTPETLQILPGSCSAFSTASK
jgi:hypothetical protein